MDLSRCVALEGILSHGDDQSSLRKDFFPLVRACATHSKLRLVSDEERKERRRVKVSDDIAGGTVDM